VVLQALGDPVDEEALAASIPQAPGGGVLSVDLLLAARQRGLEADLVAGSAAVLRAEVAAGRPAILMLRLLNAPGRSHDVYHYVVVDGMDPERDLFRFQLGDGKARWTTLDRLEGAWKGAGHALLRVRAPEAFAEMTAAVRLERSGRPDEAARRYRAILAEHPELARAWVNLGNAEASASHEAEAESAYRRALDLAPADVDALNNLAWLLLGQGRRLEEAEALAERAARAAAGSDRVLVLDTLARIQAARGRCAEATRTLDGATSDSDSTVEGGSPVAATRAELGRLCSAPP
jgi:tetratricopeptide (TPR) repeat protein